MPVQWLIFTGMAAAGLKTEERLLGFRFLVRLGASLRASSSAGRRTSPRGPGESLPVRRWTKRVSHHVLSGQMAGSAPGAGSSSRRGAHEI